MIGKKIDLGLSVLFDPIRNYIAFPIRRRAVRYARSYKHKSVKKKVILYEAFYGRGMLCGPYALFQELIKHPVYRKYRHVWVLDDPSRHSDLIQKYKHSRVSFVAHGSKQYVKYLASAGYLINNSTFPNYFVKKEGQVYINTWHGIPLKNLGYDEPSGTLAASNTARNFLHADYLIAANPFMTEMYRNAYRQEGISQVKIIEEGYPRLDTLVKEDRQGIYKELERQGVSVDPDKKIILYAPTWRGDTFANPNLSTDEFLLLKEVLEKRIDMDAYQILVKVHQAVYSRIRDKLEEFPYLVPATMDANVILGITDILISDFSSIYFDYLATGRPVLFYIPDLEEYSEKRGMYFGIEELPGPNTGDLEELGNWINHIDTVFAENKERYDRVRNWCCGYEIGTISRKIIQAAFEGKTENVRIVGCGNEKKKVLISRGPMMVNGISTALINLLKQFDYDQYDVTVLLGEPANEEERAQILRLDENKNVRILVRANGLTTTISEDVRNNFYLQINPIKVLSSLMYSEKIYNREFRRLFGETKFDYIIDYDGYGLFYATVCLAQKGAQTSIWLHNDMVSEFQMRFFWLKRVFSIYERFDYTVSCSRQIMETNREKLAGYLSAEKFRYAKNCVDFEKVKTGSRMGQIVSNGHAYYSFSDTEHSVTNMKLIPLQPETLTEWGEGTVDFRSAHAREDNGITRFVTVGRLSVEKNQAALIRAFAHLTEERQDVMLYILGEGPEKQALWNLIRQLDIQDHVILTGNLSNPFGLLNQCDCFLLPSLHEGQPLVVFEARALHMPIILSRFSSVGGSVLENGQYLADMDEESIYDGLCAYLAGEVPCDYVFDDDAYNREAYAEFEAAVFGASEWRRK